MKASELKNLDTLEEHISLHTTLEIIYVVDGYKVSLINDRTGLVVEEAHGKFVVEALIKLSDILKEMK